MNKSNKFMKNIVLHIKYPYTALIISIMWLGISVIVSIQKSDNIDILIAATAICTLIVAVTGFRSPK